MSDQEIYLDYAATSPVDPSVTAAMLECLQHEFGNPSSQHAAGRRAWRLVEVARATVAARVGAAPERLTFTSGATEANNLALKGVLRRQRTARPHLVTSRIEHKSVLDAARALESEGVAVTYVDAEVDGSVDPSRVAAAIRAETALVSIMHVNNETGVIQDVNAIGALCRERGVAFHVDAAQSVGKLPLDLGDRADRSLLPDGPQGVRPQGSRRAVRGAEHAARGGVAWRRAGARPARGHPGHAPDRRHGPGVRARGRADRGAAARSAARSALAGACAPSPGVRQNGAPARRAPHLLNVTFPGVDGESLRFALGGVAVSAGSACAADSPEASHVLTGMGLSDTLAASSLRFSVGRFTTEAEVERAAAAVAAAVEPAAFASRNPRRRGARARGF